MNNSIIKCHYFESNGGGRRGTTEDRGAGPPSGPLGGLGGGSWPHQLGAGLRGGGEKLAHVVRATAEARPADVWVALGLSNAFGTMFRGPAPREVAEVVPDLAAYLGMFLERDTRYRLVRSSGGAVWMRAGEGAEQGDV